MSAIANNPLLPKNASENPFLSAQPIKPLINANGETLFGSKIA